MSISKLEQLAWVMCPEDSQEDPAFPNHTDRDIWVNGFKIGFELGRLRPGQYIPVNVYYRGMLHKKVESMAKAAKITNMHKSSVSRLLKSKRKSETGWSFTHQ